MPELRPKKSMIILRKGKLCAYQDMIEAYVGPFLATVMPYKENVNKEFMGDGVRPDDDYFEGDADYELKIIKKRR